MFKKLQLHRPGMRTIKTSIAVGLCYLIFIPLNLLIPDALLPQSLHPLYACIAAVICMQTSLDKTISQGVSRLIGTALGGMVGLFFLYLHPDPSDTLLFALLLMTGTIFVIWMATAIGHPGACSVSVIVLCVITMSYSGNDATRYLYAYSRIIETAVGVLVAIIIDCVLPHSVSPKSK